MKRIAQLKREALEACRFRGHEMGRFSHKRRFGFSADVATSTCRACGMAVTVNAKPAPNEIDIGGRAVALNCLGPEWEQD